MKNSVKVIAFYLPQYHPTANNDYWWGKGFTEWTNVAKAKKLFHGHYQPHIPADLGFYDLRLPQSRKAQADLAKEAGISGFCYYHYWFGNGHKELEFPFEEVVRIKEPDFPFCLCWANESWYRKFWNKEGSVVDKRVLAEQLYLGEVDNEKHFYDLLQAFRDERYMKKDGKLIFMIYKPFQFVMLKEFMEQWQKLAVQNSIPSFFFIAYTDDANNEAQRLINLGFDAVCSCKMTVYRAEKGSLLWQINRYVRKLWMIITNSPRKADYRKVYKYFIGKEEKKENIYPVLIPNWDHTPRSGINGDVLINSSPAAFEEHFKDVLEVVRKKEMKNQIVFLKSWNEWGEGNYVEPDLKYGHGFLYILSKYLKK